MAGSRRDERACVRRAQAGSASDFEALFCTHWGPAYRAAFEDAFARIARGRSLPFVPFLLDGVALDPALYLGDGLHPNARGTARVADHVWHALEPVLRRVGGS